MRSKFSPGLPAWVVVVSLLVIMAVPQPASAKGLLETIFGFLGSQPSASPPQVTAPAQPAYGGGRRPEANPFDGRNSTPGSIYSEGGRYKTVCVRLCDGYYFPISNTSRRREFYDDAQQCRSRCDSETRLFYMRPSDPSIKQARDLNGLGYEKLKTAFLYRKKLKRGCTCRPQPWSVAERMRHKSYELVDQRPMVAEGEAPSLPANSTMLAARPAIVGEGSVAEARVMEVPKPVAMPTPPAPRAVERARFTEPRLVRRVEARPAPMAHKNWGLGAAFGGSGLPPVKYRHRWESDNN